MLAKAVLRTTGKVLLRPFLALWRIALPRVVVPVYHTLYLIRRRIQRFVRPAKNRLMYLLANRHTIHTAAVAVAVTAGVVNFQLTDVRAETYGKRSLMYGLLTADEQVLVDEYVDTSALATASPVKYREGVLSAPIGASTGVSPNMASTIVAGGTLSSLAIAEGTESVAPRDAVETYTIQEGDTLYGIASRFGISLNTLLWANSLTVRSTLKPGTTLTILPVSGVLHTVKSGDTLARISSSYGVEQDKIVAYNKLGDGSSLTVSEKLIIPGGELRAPTPTVRPSTSTVATIISSPTTATPKSSDTAGALMIWPTDLAYVVRGLSWYHTGLDIDCNGRADGTSTNDNYAAADGIVQYSGWKTGYGNTVEINHGNGLVTRYGHFHALYVQSGQSVTSGTPLGRCGSTGKSTGTHLHFEVIANGKFMNPYNYVKRP